MFTLSAKGVYGLTAVIDLAERYRTGATQIREIAERHRIPQHYLEQILVTLKKAGFVESFRGATGGYALSHEPESVTVMEVLAALEGPLSVVPEKRRDGALSFLWSDLHDHLKSFLEVSIAEIARRKAASAQQLNYMI